MAQQVVTIGSETPVNTTVTGNQHSPNLTGLSDGGWLVTWTDNSSSTKLLQQRYDAEGHPVGGDTYISSGDGFIVSNVTELRDGGWLVTWNSFINGSNDIFQRRYNAAGAPIGGQTTVNTTITGSQSDVSVTELADGGWLVTWNSNYFDDTLGTTINNIFQQRYNADGSPRGTETRVDAGDSRYPEHPDVTMLPDGGWLITWAQGVDILQRRYDANDNTVGNITVVNRSTVGFQSKPSATVLTDGGWLVTWNQPGTDGTGDILLQRYNANGDKLGAELRVNTTTTQHQQDSSVAALINGGWVVTWMSKNADNTYDVYQQAYNADGSTAGGETRVNATVAGDQRAHSVTALVDGSWVVTWQGDGTGADIYQQRFRLNNDPTGVKINNAEAVSISESLAPGDEIGTLTTDDPDSGSSFESFTYVLVDENGNALDHAFFEIVGNKLKLKAGLDYETVAQRSHTLHVKTTDSIGSTFTDTLTVNLSDANEADPATIRLNNATAVTIAESLAVGESLGTLSASDADIAQSISYALVDAAGNAFDHAFFEIAGNQLKLKAGLDYEDAAQRSHTLHIKATDSGTPARSSTQAITVHLSDVNEADPTDIKVGGATALTIVENAEPGRDFGIITASDADPGQTITGYRLLTAAGAPVGSDFPLEIVEESGVFRLKLKDGMTLDREAYENGVLIFQIQALDSGAPVRAGTQAITIAIDNVEDAPSLLSLSQSTVSELAGNTTEVGTFSAASEPGDEVSFRLVLDTSGAFAIEGNKLVVKNGFKLDFERAKTHKITVEAKDELGATVEKILTIDVTDLAREITSGSSAADIIYGGSNSDKIGGGAGNDVLRGYGGNDVLNGGLGKDTLSGGSGKDIFQFTTKASSTNVDKIADYNVSYDSIQLDNKYFTKLGSGTATKPKKLASSAFWKGAKAHDANDRIIYDSSKGYLYYDADGTGSSKQVLIATMAKNLKMTYAEFFVI